MTPETFLHEFGELAPERESMRALVLRLAVRGRLSRSMRGDEDVNWLLEKAKEQITEDIAAGVGAKRRSTADGNSAKIHFDVPEHWRWVSVENVCSYIQRGKGPKYVERSKVPVISQKCVQWSGFTMTPARFVDPKSLAKYGPERFLRAGDMLWNSTGTGTIGRVMPYRPPAEFDRVVADSHVTVLRPAVIEPRYLWVWLAGPDVQEAVPVVATGTTKQKELGTTTAASFPLPLPPLPEQKRIVAKVDRLMALCDELEEKQKKKRATSVSLNKAALNAVVTAPDKKTFKSSWKRVQDNFEVLYDLPKNVGELRQAILQLAVMGKLVRQDPTDEPAEKLVNMIALERKSTRGLGKNPRVEFSLPEHLVKWDLPPGWVWTNWAALTLGIDSGWSPQCEKNPRRANRWGVLKVSAVSWSTFAERENKELPASLKPRLDAQVKRGDFLMSRANTADLVGRSVIVKTDVSRLLMSDKILRCRFGTAVSAEYVNYLNQTSLARRHYAAKASGTSSSMKNISRDVVGTVPIPLPPLAEQKRIVAKVDHLMAVCDDLEAKLSQSQENGQRLMQAVVERLVA